MTPSPHELAAHHLPPFITAPGQSDWLLTLMGIILIGSVLGAGVFFFWLHSLPERMVHNKVQFDIVAVLALLSLFTHIHAFWVAALIIALIEFPSFSLPDISNTLGRIAGSLETMAGAQAGEAKPLPPPGSQSDAAKPAPSTPAKAVDKGSVKHAHETARKRGAEHA
jgi:multisubunit Na+/H+ antiporter MnhF subunit